VADPAVMVMYGENNVGLPVVELIAACSVAGNSGSDAARILADNRLELKAGKLVNQLLHALTDSFREFKTILRMQRTRFFFRKCLGSSLATTSVTGLMPSLDGTLQSFLEFQRPTPEICPGGSP